MSTTTTTRKTKFIITGFGKFANVVDNPSTHLINHLQKSLHTLNTTKNFEVVKTDILEVSAQAVNKYLQDIETNVLKVNNNNNNNNNTTDADDHQDNIVLLHLGVSGLAKELNIERFGWNCANFANPDEAGWTALNEAINDTCQIHNSIETNLPTNQLVNSLAGKKHKVQESTDPGRFICNYIYFSSLCLSQRYKCKSLFVHIPHFEAIDFDSQREIGMDDLYSASNDYNMWLDQREQEQQVPRSSSSIVNSGGGGGYQLEGDDQYEDEDDFLLPSSNDIDPYLFITEKKKLMEKKRMERELKECLLLLFSGFCIFCLWILSLQYWKSRSPVVRGLVKLQIVTESVGICNNCLSEISSGNYENLQVEVEDD
ncbi:hypothetical protein DFA_03774 [Cavenderia fasciculata]|uniref:Uncharacterized protein n=1 Tax=Cavenderia fasciculata TaxID=261658 RepID=F4Q0C9_CACFS|nr:uncharacterized protein DFA_03774 [Cavenderia fasciculata]EGG18280.1 hypothetical protein DFA_03774 [Cavenderia fasciculata]|eukprot:XP_004357103.1 hypothetical protein DFA_03774 [Cavenderia fasciculata]